ncbi:MAG: pyridoxamine 5'-phosphate oxidase family protein [Desulfovibrio sp.]|jgi:nitroimidazol reductase NimA-like FMN-containing flavoprotein (pyridoxamine 5'-phosphate oxidase superfamily)|nr:pyridoxamine 5'-phosphate oxidase family protein [Desulfovibrio sp.]
MRRMTQEEMRLVIGRCRWATICSVCEDGSPYAIEATPFFMGDAHCFMINPRGGTWRNLRGNPQVLLKYTLATEDLSVWAGVSCRGPGEFVHDANALCEGWGLLGKVMGADYSQAAEKFARCADRSPLFRVLAAETTGRCSASKDEDFVLP